MKYRRTVAAILLVFFSGFLVWQLFSEPGFSTLNTDCKAEQIIDLKPRDGYFEVHVGGWINDGTVIIGGPFTNPQEVTFGKGSKEIARSYVGDWYNDNFLVNIKPSKGASCYIRIVFGYKTPYNKTP